jgi:hypothetical protein
MRMRLLGRNLTHGIYQAPNPLKKPIINGLPLVIKGLQKKELNMKLIKMAPILVLAVVFSSDIYAYGSGGGGGSSCSEPQFSGESPKNESTVSKLDTFVVEASKNTDLKSLQLEVDGTRQEPKVTTLLTGDYRLEVPLSDVKLQSQKVRITIRARSDEGCDAFQPYYIHVKP